MTSATAWRPARWTRRPVLGFSCWDTSWYATMSRLISIAKRAPGLSCNTLA